jgi:hypothetical protein
MLLILKILIFIENLLVALLLTIITWFCKPIGGQSAIVKWKWGQDADEMLKPT